MIRKTFSSRDTGYLCEDLIDDFAITIAQLTQWNTWISSSGCDTDLYANLGYQDKRAVCVGVNASAPTHSATKPPGGSPTTTGGAQGPTQTGVVEGCQQFYTVQSGDSCASIDAMAGISFEQFYAWNPSGKR